MNTNDYVDKLKDIDIPEIPPIAKGTAIPLQTGRLEAELKAYKDKSIRKEGYRHNWKIAVFSSVCGGISGLLGSLLFWFIENRLLS